MTRIRLIRHAESETNIGNKTEFPRNTPITEFGNKQAQQLAQKLKTSIKPTSIYYSSYIRTQQTASPLIQYFPHTAIEELDFIHEFHYLCSHKYKGTNIDERSAAKDFFRNQPIEYRDGEQTESIIDFMQRLQQCIQYMQSLEGGLHLFFTHGGIISGIMYLLQNTVDRQEPHIKKKLRYLFEKPIKNTEIIKLHKNKQGTMYIKSSKNITI